MKIDGGFIDGFEAWLASLRAGVLSSVIGMFRDTGYSVQAEEMPRLILETGGNQLASSSCASQNREVSFDVVVYSPDRGQHDALATVLSDEFEKLNEDVGAITAGMLVGAGCRSIEVIDFVEAQERQRAWSSRFSLVAEISIPRRE